MIVDAAIAKNAMQNNESVTGLAGGGGSSEPWGKSGIEQRYDEDLKRVCDEFYQNSAACGIRLLPWLLQRKALIATRILRCKDNKR
jgi:hypothetical protein